MAIKSLEDLVKHNPALLRDALANPRLRHQLPAKYLTPAQQRERKKNTRLKQPIVPGSTVTERALAHEATAAMDVKYGPRQQADARGLGEEKTAARDVGGFYDQYLRQVAQHSRNVQAIGGAATQAGLGLQAGVTGLSAAGLNALQSPATLDAWPRGVAAGDLSQMASNAAAVRQSLVGSFVGQQAGANAANANYADARAHLIAPGQKLGAQAMAQGRVRRASDRIKATAAERGADDFAYRAGRRADEGKTVLAGQIAGVNATDKLQDNALNAGKLGETKRHNTAAEKAAAKAAKAKRADAAAKRADADAVPNQYGIPAGVWRGMSTTDRQNTIRDFKASGGKGGGGKGANGKDKHKWLTPGQAGAGLVQLPELKLAASRAKTGAPFVKGHTRQKPMTPEEARQKILTYKPLASTLKHPALVDAAVDAAFDGFLHDATVRALKAAGYRPSEIARTLGVPTSAQAGPSPHQKGSGAPGSGRPG